MAYTKESFEDKMFKEPNTGCWLSDGKSPYGPIKISYRLFKGPVIKGLDIMHSCDTPACVNPDHLSQGTRTDNVRDCRDKGRLRTGWMLCHKTKTHCPKGHPYSEENTFIDWHAYPSANRKCKICLNERSRKRHARERLKKQRADSSDPRMKL